MKSILAVDDAPALLSLLVAMLRLGGHSPIEASSGEEGIEVLKAPLPIDGLVTDIKMPGMTGFELARHFRTQVPDGPILFVSGYFDTEEEDYMHWLQLPKVAFLHKPFDPGTFLKQVGNLFDS